MLLNAVGFLIALLLAIPTFGLSLLAFFVIKFLIDIQAVPKIAHAARSAQIGEPVATTFVNNAAVRMFYSKYGVTEKKHETFMSPVLSFIGYVNVGKGETIAVIQKAKEGVVVSCVDPPVRFGNDLGSLMAKEKLVKDVMQEFRSGA